MLLYPDISNFTFQNVKNLKCKNLLLLFSMNWEILSKKNFTLRNVLFFTFCINRPLWVFLYKIWQVFKCFVKCIKHKPLISEECIHTYTQPCNLVFRKKLPTTYISNIHIMIEFIQFFPRPCLHQQRNKILKLPIFTCKPHVWL